MPSDRELDFTHEAEDDILGILQYTQEEWGEFQVQRYLGALERAFQTLQTFPHLGKPHPELKENVRTYRVREHVVYYVAHDLKLAIVRVLHRSHDTHEDDIPDPSGA